MQGYTSVSVDSDVSPGVSIDVMYCNSKRDFMTIVMKESGGEEMFIHLRPSHARIVAAAIVAAADDVKQDDRQETEEKAARDE